MPVLNIHSTILVYGDAEAATANPQRRYVDWARHVTSVTVGKPSVREYVVEPGASLLAFSGMRSIGLDATTEFEINLVPTKDSVYRITSTGGTDPAFRTNRNLELAGRTVTVSINNNATATMELDDDSPPSNFSSVQVGDVLFLPHVVTGDSASPFNPNNAGFWTVLAVTSRKLTLRRRVGEAFSGVAETRTVQADSQLLAFSAAGIQRGDTLEIVSGFSSVTQKTFEVSEVTSNWVEFVSTEALPLEQGVVPGVGGLVFYSDAKRFVRVETDQEAVVRLNGDVGNSNRLSPRVVGDSEKIAYFEKWGPVWELVVVNRSTTSPMVVNLISAE
ncbi:hypothetical protein [Myxococcus phage Mx1]|nr:hypothetical protein [Myxococcus phage Mx1]